MHIICYVQNWLNRYIIYIFSRVIQSIKIGAGRFFSHSRNILDKLMDTHRSMMFDRRRMFGHVIRWKAFFLLKHWNIYIYFLIKRIFFLLTNGYSTPKLIHCQFTSINQLKTRFLLFVFFFLSDICSYVPSILYPVLLWTIRECQLISFAQHRRMRNIENNFLCLIIFRTVNIYLFIHLFLLSNRIWPQNLKYVGFIPKIYSDE